MVKEFAENMYQEAVTWAKARLRRIERGAEAGGDPAWRGVVRMSARGERVAAGRAVARGDEY